MRKLVVTFALALLLTTGLIGYGALFPSSVIGATFLILTDGTHTVIAPQKVTVTGATVGGSNNAATLNFSGGSSGLSGMVAGQIPIAASANTITSSFSLGTGVQTFLSTPLSANLAAAITDKTGSGSAVFGTSPILTTPTINGANLSGGFAGTPSYSGIPLFSGLSNVTCSNGAAFDAAGHLGKVSCPAGSGISGLTSGQVAIAGGATSVTSSLPFSGSSGVTEVVSATSATKTSGHTSAWDTNGNLVDSGVVPAVGANPTGTIGVVANNGSAATFQRSDASPAISKCSASIYGACEVDGTTITANNGVISAGSLSVFPSEIHGCSLSSNVAFSAAIDIAPCTSTSDDNLQSMTASGVFQAKLLNTAWAAGSYDVGCLDTGSIAASKWYTIYEISNGTTTDYLCSTSNPFTITWGSGARLSSNITLANDGMTAIAGSGSISSTTYATVAQGTGKHVFAIILSPTQNTTNTAVGLGDASAASNSYTLGSDTHSVGWFANGAVKINGTTLSTIATYSQGNTLYGAFDAGNQKLWLSVNGGLWNNSGAANPDTNVGGISTASLAFQTVFPAVTLFSGSNFATGLFAVPLSTLTNVTTFSQWGGPIYPSGYTKKRRIGSILTNGSSTVTPFSEIIPISGGSPRKYLWSTPVLDINATTLGTTATVEQLGGVPPGVRATPLCRYTMSNTGNSLVLNSPNSAIDQTPTTTVPFTSVPGWDQIDETLTAGVSNSACPDMTTDVNQHIRVIASAASTSLYLITKGWME